ncbi:MAG: hypothetical protein AAGH79_12820, partial [Bacteroidota bacterium]
MRKTLLLLLFTAGLGSLAWAQPANGNFEEFGTNTYSTFARNGGMFNPATCSIDGGTLDETGTVNAADRPLGWRTTDDFFGGNAPFYTTSTTDAYEGNSAVYLNGTSLGVFGTVGLFDIETLVQETVPVAYDFEELPISIDGFYKHTSGTPVTLSAGTCVTGGPLTEETTFEGGFAVYAQFYDEMDNLIAAVDTVFQDAADYTAFSAPVNVIDADATPAKILLVFSTCPEFLSPNPIAIVGSESYLDNVSFVGINVNTNDLG